MRSQHGLGAPVRTETRLTRRVAWLVCAHGARAWRQDVLESRRDRNHEKSFMKNMTKRSFILVAALGAFAATGCRTPKTPAPEPPAKIPITSIRVGNFQCDDAVTAQAVRNVFIEMLMLRGDAKLVREGEADVVIEGTVTTAKGESSSSRIGGGRDWVAGKSQGTGGDYVSGITSIALRSGEILTSASWGQVIASGRELLPPESVARTAADRMLAALLREGLKRRQDR